MKTWAARFWKDHGDRIIFMAIVAVFGVIFIHIDMVAEGKVLLIADATLALNKARSTPKEEKPKD